MLDCVPCWKTYRKQRGYLSSEETRTLQKSIKSRTYPSTSDFLCIRNIKQDRITQFWWNSWISILNIFDIYLVNLWHICFSFEISNNNHLIFPWLTCHNWTIKYQYRPFLMFNSITSTYRRLFNNWYQYIYFLKY
jgi:hypothetical protein